jgi:hypothetical protein
MAKAKGKGLKGVASSAAKQAKSKKGPARKGPMGGGIVGAVASRAGSAAKPATKPGHFGGGAGTGPSPVARRPLKPSQRGPGGSVRLSAVDRVAARNAKHDNIRNPKKPAAKPSSTATAATQVVTNWNKPRGREPGDGK